MYIVSENTSLKSGVNITINPEVQFRTVTLCVGLPGLLSTYQCHIYLVKAAPLDSRFQVHILIQSCGARLRKEKCMTRLGVKPPELYEVIAEDSISSEPRYNLVRICWPQ